MSQSHRVRPPALQGSLSYWLLWNSKLARTAAGRLGKGWLQGNREKLVVGLAFWVNFPNPWVHECCFCNKALAFKLPLSGSGSWCTIRAFESNQWDASQHQDGGGRAKPNGIRWFGRVSHTHTHTPWPERGQYRPVCRETCWLSEPEAKLEKIRNLLKVGLFECFFEASTSCMKMSWNVRISFVSPKNWVQHVQPCRRVKGLTRSNHQMMKIKYEHTHFDLFEGFFLTA